MHEVARKAERLVFRTTKSLPKLVVNSMNVELFYKPSSCAPYLGRQSIGMVPACLLFQGLRLKGRGFGWQCLWLTNEVAQVQVKSDFHILALGRGSVEPGRSPVAGSAPRQARQCETLLITCSDYYCVLPNRTTS